MNNGNYYNLINGRIYPTTNKKGDQFVGIIYCNDKLEIKLPLGFELNIPKNGKEKKEFRENLKILIYTIKEYYNIRDKDDDNSDSYKVVNSFGKIKYNNFPIYSYDFIIQDFISNGYYFEKETIYKETNNGKINWNRTIKKEKSYIDGDNVFYLKFIRRKTNILNDELITLLHKTCVYESFEKWGFMYFDKNISEKPRISIKEAGKYVKIIKTKLAKTFSDRYKMLFNHMINVIEHNAKFSENVEYKYGVDYFHPVWEKMIDEVFGISETEKNKYFPNAKWHICKGINNNNEIIYNDPPKDASNLRPDTIMKYNDEIYVLDAKYYGFKSDTEPKLPATSDINKQITYGKYVEDKDKIDPHNAFILPFNKKAIDESKSYLKAINNQNTDKTIFTNYYGFADIKEVADSNNHNYARVVAIQMDIKDLMQKRYTKASEDEQNGLANAIKKAINKINDDSTTIISFKEKLNDIKRICNDFEQTKLAASIDLNMFESVYKAIGNVIDKFNSDNE